MPIGAAKFIMQGGTAVVHLGRLLRYGGMLQYLKNPKVPMVGISLVGALKGLGALEDKEGKARKDNVFRKVARVSGTVLEKPGQLMEMTGEDFFKSDLTVKTAMKATAAAVGADGEAIEETVHAANPKYASLNQTITTSQEKGLGFARTAATQMGGLLEGLNSRFNFTGKTDKKIAEKEAELAELRKGFSTLANEIGGFDKVKAKFGKEVNMASTDTIVKSLKSAPKRLDAAAGRQAAFEDLTLSARRKVTNPNHKRNEVDLDATQAKIMQKLAKDTAGEGKLSKDVQHHIEKYSNAHKDLNELKSKKNFWENPEEGIKQKIKNTTTSDVVDYGMRYGAVAMQGMQNIRQTKIGIRTIKQLMADLQGKSPQSIPTMKALFGKASPAVKEARRQFWKTMLPQNLLFGASTVLQEFGAQKIKRNYGSSSMLSSVGIPIAFQAIQQLGGLIGKGNTMLQNYADLRIAQESGTQLDATNYATLLAAASKDIKAIGGEMNHNTVLIAQYYAENQTPIADVMKDINAGKKTLMERSQQGQEVIKQYGLAKQASMQVEQAAAKKDTPLVQGEGKFTGQTRNQPAAQGNFADKAVASHEHSSATHRG